MSASTPKPKTAIYRTPSFWLISLFALYSLFGWLILPAIVDSQLKSQLKQLAGWDTQVEQVIFNPYTLSLRVNEAEIQDSAEQTIIRFDSLFINFSLLQSITGTISFDEIALAEPFIYLDIDQSGQTNFQRAFASDTAETRPEPADEDSAMIALFFNTISIASGQVHLHDASQGEAFTLDIEPISLSLDNFSTLHNDGGEYALAVSLANEQKIKWHGQIGIAPFQSSGHLELENIASSSYWHYIKSVSPYWLNQASISLSGDYQTAVLPDITQLSIDNATLNIKDVSLSEHQDSSPLLTLESLQVAPISFDLSELSLDLGSIELNTLGLAIERAADSSLNLLRPLDISEADNSAPTPNTHSNENNNDTELTENLAQSAEPTSEKSDAPTSSFHWKIADLNINSSQISWKDLALADPAELKLTDLALKVGTLSDDLSQAFPYDVSFQINGAENSPATELANKNRIHGELSPQPFMVKGKTAFSDIALTAFQPYLSEATHIAIQEGRFSLQSEYDLQLLDKLQGNVSASLSIDDLALTDKVLNKSLGGFKQFSIDPVTINFLGDANNSLNIDIPSILLDQPYGDIVIAEDGQMNLSHLAKTSSEPELPEVTDPTIEKAVEQPSETISLLLSLFELKQGQFNYRDASLDPAFQTQLSSLNGRIENVSSNTEAKSSVSFTGDIDAQGKLKVEGTLNPLSANPYTDLNIFVNNVNLNMASPYSAKYAGYLIDKGKLDLDLNYQINGSQLKAKNQILLNQFQFGKSVKSKDATNLPLPLAIGMLKDRNDKIDLSLPISGDLNDPSFRLSSVILNTFVNLITKVVTSPFSILGSLIEGSDDISEVDFSATSKQINEAQKARILTLTEALEERPKLTLEIRGSADATLDQQNNTPLSEPALLQLAKDRAAAISRVVIEEGNIEASRVFILEPEITRSPAPETNAESTPEQTEAAAPMIPSKFTLGVR
ncbi:MAG: DUF748 domain-containing protein [Oleiphilus sp.]